MSARLFRTRKLTLIRCSTSGLKRLKMLKLLLSLSLSKKKRLNLRSLISTRLQLLRLNRAQSLKLSQRLRRRLKRKMLTSTFNLLKSSLLAPADLRKIRIAQTRLRLRATLTSLPTLSTSQIALKSPTRTSLWLISMFQPTIKYQ